MLRRSWTAEPGLLAEEGLEANHDDLRAALKWCRAHDNKQSVRLALALAWFWLMHWHVGRGRR